MGQTVSGFVTSNGAAIDVDIGFIPDYVELYNFDAGATANLGLKWFRCLADDPETAAHGRYGIAIADGGDITFAAAATNGIIPYDGAKTPRVRIPAPDGDGMVTALVDSDFVAGDTKPTARSTSVVGTIYRPSTHNGYVYECTTSTTTLGTEPTWPTTPGESVTDDASNTFICREEDIINEGGLGFEIGASLAATADDVIVFKAEKHLRSDDMGDAATTDPVTF